MKKIFCLLISFISCLSGVIFNNAHASLYEGVIYWAPNTGGTLFFDLSEEYEGLDRISSSGFSGSWSKAGGINFNVLYQLFGFGVDFSYNIATQYIAPVTTDNTDTPVATTYTSREALPIIFYDQIPNVPFGSDVLLSNGMRVDLTMPSTSRFANVSTNVFSGNETFIVKPSAFASSAFLDADGSNILSLGYAVTKQNVFYMGGNLFLNHNIAKRVSLGGKFSGGFALLNTGMTEMVATVSPGKTGLLGDDTNYDPSKTVVSKNGEVRISTIHLASKLGGYSSFAISETIALLFGVDFFKVFDRTYHGKVPMVSTATNGYNSNGTMVIGRSVVLFNLGIKVLL